MDIIKKQVRLAEIGAAGLAAGFKSAVSMPVAEELRGAVGEQDYQTIQQSFEQAKLLSDQQSRLARIEGQTYSDLEAIRGVVGRDVENQLASQKRAEREVITRFGGRSGVTSTSLRSSELI
jgi:ATP phosphoribosyltransferase regulatory subunit HisZ